MQRDEFTKEEVRYVRHQFTTGVSHRKLVSGSQTERKYISYFLFFFRSKALHSIHAIVSLS